MDRQRLYTVCIGASSGGRFSGRSVRPASVFHRRTQHLCRSVAVVRTSSRSDAINFSARGSRRRRRCALALIGATFDETERGRAIGTWAASAAVATAIAPLLGGWIVDHFSWRWIFLINPLIALPAIWIAYCHVPESRDPDAKPGLDWRGTILLLLGLGGLAYGLIASPVSGWRDPVVLVSITGGMVLLIGFVYAEYRSRTPILPLSLFRSRTFSAVNLLTLLLYGALNGVFFFLPFALIQVHGYPATFAGAAFLPFTIIMAALSRWAGGLLDRFGARLPLMIGPAIAAIGIGVMGLMVANGSYTEFLVSIAILGLGMVITVAPLTATVINAVPAHKTGVASGISDTVASVGNLLAIAILSAVALSILDHELTRNLQNPALSDGVKHAIQAARGQLVIEPALSNIQGADRASAESILKASLADSISWAMLIAAALALSGAAAGALIPRRSRGSSGGHRTGEGLP